MILGRKKKAQATLDEAELGQTELAPDAEAARGVDAVYREDNSTTDAGASEPVSKSNQDAPDDITDDKDEWTRLDESKDWREQGPFDITEVDLDADEVDRLDFGSLVLTPFENMQMQLQVEQASGQIQAIMVMSGQSAIELVLFAAPARTSMLPEIRGEMIKQAEEAHGNAQLVAGPFGTEIRRILPLATPDGQQGLHVSRTWFAQGPRWLLRGTVMGEAAMADNLEGPVELLYEFFANIVVRRGNNPMVPGALITMMLPPQLATSQPQSTPGAAAN